VSYPDSSTGACVTFGRPQFPRSDKIAALRRDCREPLQNTVSVQKKAVRFYVSGLVQGVGYRYFVHRAARQLGVAGYVKNLNDGRVEVFAIGAEEQLRALRADLNRGPQGATVQDVAETAAHLLKEFESDFSIEHDY